MSGSSTTVIRDAAWIAAWDGHRHRYLRDGDVAFTDDRIVHVGGRYDGPCDLRIDGARRFVMPGLVNIHSHPHTEPANKGVREDHGVPEMFDTGLYERSCAFFLDEPGRQAAMEMSYAELLLGGVTTVADLSSQVEGWLDLAGRSGLRVYVGPFFADAFWKLENQHELHFDWDEARGRRYFDEALRTMDRAEQHPSGRLRASSIPARSRPARRRLCATRPPTRARRDAPHDPHLAVEARVPGGSAPPRQDPARICTRHRLPRPRRHPRTRALHRRAPGHPVARREGPRSAGRLRGIRGALPFTLRPLRPGDDPLRRYRARGINMGWGPMSPPTVWSRRCASPSCSPG